MLPDRPPHFLVVGALHLDVIVRAPHLPRIDETLPGTDVRYALGGKAGNQAVAVSRMGARVDLMSMVGTDDFAARMLATLDRAGVGRVQVQAVDGASGMSVAIEDARGNYGAVIVGGANRKLRAERVAFPRECAAILIQNEIDEALNVYLARRAQATRIPVIWNAAPARALAPDLARMTDVLIVNRVEAADILGTSPEGLDPIVAAEALAEKGPTAVIVTLGADGAVLAEGGHVQRAAAFPVPQKSSHGAGDAFVGAFAAEWRRGASMEEALRFAQGAAALVVATPPEDRADVTQAAVRGFMAGRSQIR